MYYGILRSVALYFCPYRAVCFKEYRVIILTLTIMNISTERGHGEDGTNYSLLRIPDPYIELKILDALGDAESVLNVGAGTGSYEPRKIKVVAVDSSFNMIKQRPEDAAPAVQASAEWLPFMDSSFDAVLAVLTLHHWADTASGLMEMARVARKRVIIVTWDPASDGFWLGQKYFPEILERDREIFPTMNVIRDILGPISARELPIPAACSDGFLGAYWRRPHAYLDESVRSGMSTFSKITSLGAGLQLLKDDLENGDWEKEFANILAKDYLDAGYRILVAETGSR